MQHTDYTITNNEEEMQFEIELEEEKALLVYRFHKKDIAFMHTEVPDKFSGRGVGNALVIAAFSYASEQKKLVMVFCPFVAAFLKRHPDYMVYVDPQYKGLS